MQLVPFKFVGDILRRAHIVPSQPRTYTGIFNPAFFQFLFNVIMTVPFGIYLRYYFKCRFLKTLILSFCLSLFFELTQLSGLYFIYPRSYRLFDVDDLLANTLGGVFGYAIISPFLKILPSRERIDKVSFHRGRQVSLTRRLISAMFDLIVVALLGGLASTFLRIFHLDIPHFGAMVLFLYFSLVPMVFKGRTFGKFITKTRIASFKNVRTRWYQYPLRVGSFLLVMYVIPWLFYRILIPWLDRRSAAAAGLALLSLMVSGIYFFYLFFAAIFRKQWFFQMAPGAFNILAVRNSHTYTVAVISPAGPYNDQTVITGCVNRRPIGEIYIPVHMKLLFGKWHRLGPWGILGRKQHGRVAHSPGQVTGQLYHAHVSVRHILKGMGKDQVWRPLEIHIYGSVNAGPAFWCNHILRQRHKRPFRRVTVIKDCFQHHIQKVFISGVMVFMAPVSLIHHPSMEI